MKDSKILLIVIAGALLGISASAQDPTQHQHPQPTAPQPQQTKPEAPPADTAGPALTLEELERLALEHNPTLRQADAEIRVAAGRERQAGLWPNPSIGYVGEEIRGGRVRGGQQGFFVEQEIVLGGKLGLSRGVQEQERVQAQAEAEEQRFRVLNAVRLLYYQALSSQETLRVRGELSQLAAQAVDVSRKLFNVGQADEPDVLQSEIEAQQADLALTAAQNRHDQIWRALAAVVGQPEMQPARVAGNLEQGIPEVDEKEFIDLVRNSPAARIAEAGVRRAELQLSRQRREPLPNLRVRAGLQQNRELIEATGSPVGMQGFAEIGVQIPIFNRNQGNVSAAHAEVERARAEQRRVELVLRERAAALLRSYRDARAAAEKYRTAMLPRAQRAYQLYLEKYQQMGAAYPQVLVAQRTWFQLQTNYIAALQNVWTNAIALRGFLLTDGLEAPARAGEMDQPVREINVPVFRGGEQND